MKREAELAVPLGGRVQQARDARASGTDHRKRRTGAREDLPEARHLQQGPLERELQRLEVLPFSADADEIGRGIVEAIGDDAVAPRQHARHQARAVDPRLRRKHRAALGKLRGGRTEAAEVRRQRRPHHIRPEPVEHHDENLAHPVPGRVNLQASIARSQVLGRKDYAIPG